MKRILPMPTEGGGVISIEVADDELTGPAMRGSSGPAFLEKSVQSFETVVASIHPVALALVQQFANLASGTNSVRIKFGVKISAAAGAIIASAGSDANFEVEILWERSVDK